MNDHKFELRHRDDNRLLAWGSTLTEFFASVYDTAVDLVDESNMYVNRILVANGSDVNDLLSSIDSGDIWRVRV